MFHQTSFYCLLSRRTYRFGAIALLVLALTFMPLGGDTPTGSAFAQAIGDGGDDDKNGAASGPPFIIGQLRQKLAAEQRAYHEFLARSAVGGSPVPPTLPSSAVPTIDPPAASVEVVDKLRADLRLAVVAELPHSSEVELAVRQASIRHLSERIAAYERAYGVHDGEPTTRWNVLSEADLRLSEERLSGRLRLLLVDVAGSPETSLSEATRGHIHELRAEMEAIRVEGARRVGGDPRLLSISRTVTATEPARAVAAIQAFEGVHADLQAERSLLVEINKRLSWCNSDASLTLVRDHIHRGPYQKVLIAKVKNAAWDIGWPPGRGPPPTEPRPPGPDLGGGPPPKDSPGGARAAIEDVRHSVAKEIEALVKRNPLQQAEAAAGREVGSSWLSRLVGFRTRGFAAALAVLSPTEVHSHVDTLTQWKAELVRQQAATVTDWKVAAELQEVESRLQQFKTEIMIRGPPPAVDSGPRGPEALLRAAVAADAPASQSYAAYAELALEQRRLIELEGRLTTASETARSEIREAIAKQLERRLELERKIVNEAHARAVEAERQAFINGRGIGGAQAAQHSHDAQISIRLQADGIRARVDHYAHGDLVALERIPALRGVEPPPIVAARSLPLPELLDTHARIATAAGENAAFRPKVSLSAGRIEITEAPTPLRFDRHFTRSGLNSAEAFRANPIRAPGGVVVDVKLPQDLATRLAGIRYDATKHAFEVRVDEKWLRISPSVPPQTARAALGFLLDERVAAVDIGSFDNVVLNWLVDVELLQASEMKTAKNRNSLLKMKEVLRIVRMNPALADTTLGRELIGADELIFKALSLDPIVEASRTVFHGIDTLDLHARLRQDLQGLHEPPQTYKSILTVDRIKVGAADDQELRLLADFDYAVYALPHRLDRVGAWFKQHDGKLRSVSRELVSLEQFAIAVSLLKWARDTGRADQVAGLRFVVETGSPTPSLICQSRVRAECEEELFKKLTSVVNDDEG